MEDDEQSVSDSQQSSNDENFFKYCEGQSVPGLGKKIKVLITAEENFIVFLDENLVTQYLTNDAYGDIPGDFGEVMNQVGYLEALSSDHLTRLELPVFRRILGESIARLIVNNTNYSFYFLLFICAASGASERIVPNLIQQVENSLIQGKPDNTTK